MAHYSWDIKIAFNVRLSRLELKIVAIGFYYLLMQTIANEEIMYVPAGKSIPQER